MSELEALKAMLDDCGIERGELTLLGEVIPSGVTWQGDMCEWAAIYSDGDGLVLAVYRDFLTAQQAIDATLGRGECRMEQTCHERIAGFDAYHDEFMCSECGGDLFEGYNFCPKCGRHIVGDA